ncbi:hypothetical protein BDK51DRAFT_44397 [Blyttiomyces helicus]|uniref:Uncharacterized protein n=1 Tax=Blyttiomyces helicus TaxID=388810 RepID=A0A4P9WAM7_9FUNG|nr:hypothetical protein BDK51DRAFT_44397 [Blyttiomyces helicus]|eukprot:RKO89651.1 hypothetical protein BDK51DRAFT_44397 [Blyttiomyces helicus]
MGFLAFAMMWLVGWAALSLSPAGVPIAASIGFSATGPVAGTIAPAAQSYIGSVAAGSTFAKLQTGDDVKCLV